MKKLLTLFTLSLVLTSGLFAQSLVGTEPTFKNALLEEFTGVNCGYCPDGHRLAQNILNNNPGRAFVIAVHAGGYANTTPDFRTDYGQALADQSGLTGYPSGTVNRHTFGAAATAMGRGSWTGACNVIMSQMSPVNIGATSAYEASTRTLTITVELYYTANAPASTNFINVALIQDSIYGPQSGGGAGSNYRHMHMLRHLVTGQWGDEVTTTTQGTLVTRTYTYVVPAHYRNVPAIVPNMKVIAFVTEGHQQVYTATEVDAIAGGNAIIGSMTSTDKLIKKGLANDETTFNLEASSNIDGNTPFEFSFETTNLPADWQIAFQIDGIEYTESATINLNRGESKQIILKVIPSATGAFPAVTMQMKSLANPTVLEQKISTSIIAGITDMLVNGTGGTAATTHQGVYTDAFDAANITSYSVIDANKMIDLVNADAFGDVFTYWINISWTTPSITAPQAMALKSIMDAGQNVFIAGQNIAWDIMSGESGSNGNPANKNIFTHYLKAIYKNNGSLSTNKITSVTGDPIFGDVGSSNFVTNLGSNWYADEIDAATGADIIFNYNTPSQHAAIKYDAPNYRSIYFAVGLEMLANTEVRNQIVSLSREWLADGMVGIEYDEAVNALLNGQNYPNPASDYTFINVSEAAKGGMVEIYNLNGQLVASQSVGNSVLVRLNLSELNKGMYVYRVVSGNIISEARKLTVIK